MAPIKLSACRQVWRKIVCPNSPWLVNIQEIKGSFLHKYKQAVQIENIAFSHCFLLLVKEKASQAVCVLLLVVTIYGRLVYIIHPTKCPLGILYERPNHNSPSLRIIFIVKYITSAFSCSQSSENTFLTFIFKKYQYPLFLWPVSYDYVAQKYENSR